MASPGRASLPACSVVGLALVLSLALGEENPEAFTRIAQDGYCPVWSPDGTSIVYGSVRNGAYDIRTVRLADKETRQLTTGGGFHPALSPDGKYVTYDDRGARGRIYRMPVTGGEPVRITPESTEGNFSAWSPDGSTIVFESGGAIWRVPSQGGEATRVISRDAHLTRPAISPDGKRIAFDSADGEQSENRDLWIYDLLEKTYSRLTDDRGKDMQPNWSPDGTMIAYMSERSGNKEIWIMKADGSGAVQVTFNKGADVWPRWSPDGKKIAFG